MFTGYHPVEFKDASHTLRSKWCTLYTETEWDVRYVSNEWNWRAAGTKQMTFESYKCTDLPDIIRTSRRAECQAGVSIYRCRNARDDRRCVESLYVSDSVYALYSHKSAAEYAELTDDDNNQRVSTHGSCLHPPFSHCHGRARQLWKPAVGQRSLQTSGLLIYTYMTPFVYTACRQRNVTDRQVVLLDVVCAVDLTECNQDIGEYARVIQFQTLDGGS